MKKRFFLLLLLIFTLIFGLHAQKYEDQPLDSSFYNQLDNENTVKDTTNLTDSNFDKFQSKSTTRLIFETLLALIFIVVLIFLFIYALKLIMKKMGAKSVETDVTVKMKSFINPKLQVYLLEHKGKEYLIACNDNHITLLDKHNAEYIEGTEDNALFQTELKKEIEDYDRIDELNKEINELKERLKEK